MRIDFFKRHLAFCLSSCFSVCPTSLAAKKLNTVNADFLNKQRKNKLISLVRQRGGYISILSGHERPNGTRSFVCSIGRPDDLTFCDNIGLANFLPPGENCKLDGTYYFLLIRALLCVAPYLDLEENVTELHGLRKRKNSTQVDLTYKNIKKIKKLGPKFIKHIEMFFSSDKKYKNSPESSEFYTPLDLARITLSAFMYPFKVSSLCPWIPSKWSEERKALAESLMLVFCHQNQCKKLKETKKIKNKINIKCNIPKAYKNFFVDLTDIIKSEGKKVNNEPKSEKYIGNNTEGAETRVEQTVNDINNEDYLIVKLEDEKMQDKPKYIGKTRKEKRKKHVMKKKLKTMNEDIINDEIIFPLEKKNKANSKKKSKKSKSAINFKEDDKMVDAPLVCNADDGLSPEKRINQNNEQDNEPNDKSVQDSNVGLNPVKLNQNEREENAPNNPFVFYTNGSLNPEEQMNSNEQDSQVFEALKQIFAI